ncbi:MAG: hypothetical protein EOP47_04645 [Sphingobacteriaceae bacterium]|nr:MAG: hypothetical protein EOP47_04645 [Sphingobacteriaceae bacterium]
MKKTKQSFNIIELQTISHYAAILRACSGIQPFQLANNINRCKVAADTAIEEYKSQFELIEERKTEAPDQSKKDMMDLFNKHFDIEMPELSENSFLELDIVGDKEVLQQNGDVKKFSYRDAYFNLLGLVIN